MSNKLHNGCTAAQGEAQVAVQNAAETALNGARYRVRDLDAACAELAAIELDAALVLDGDGYAIDVIANPHAEPVRYADAGVDSGAAKESGLWTAVKVGR